MFCEKKEYFFSPDYTFDHVQVKRILYEEEEGSSESSQPGSASSEDEDIFEETAQVMQTQNHTVTYLYTPIVTA